VFAPIRSQPRDSSRNTRANIPIALPGSDCVNVAVGRGPLTISRGVAAEFDVEIGVEFVVREGRGNPAGNCPRERYLTI
jgi:hypothetical protein